MVIPVSENPSSYIQFVFFLIQPKHIQVSIKENWENQQIFTLIYFQF